jgi:hypothetical protein
MEGKLVKPGETVDVHEGLMRELVRSQKVEVVVEKVKPAVPVEEPEVKKTHKEK